MLLFFSKNSLGEENRFAQFFIQKSGAIDINNDGKIDLTIKEINLTTSFHIFTPSWDPSFRRVSEIRSDQIQSSIYINKILYGKSVIRRYSMDKKYRDQTIFSDFKQNRPQQKLLIEYSEPRGFKVVTSFKRINRKWKLTIKSKEKLSPTVIEEQICYKNISFAPLWKLNQVLSSTLTNQMYYTKIGLRIDAESCPKETISQFDEAIQIILDQYLPCFSEVRPDAAAELVTNLITNQNIVRCSSSDKTPDGTPCSAYTYTSSDSDIFFCSLKSNHFDLVTSEIANRLFHEMLHHHFPYSPDHNKGGREDAIYGCSSICSGFRNSDPKKIPISILENFNYKGCESCFSSELINQELVHLNQENKERQIQSICSESSIYKEIDNCKSQNSNQSCDPFLLQTFSEPRRKECLKTYDLVYCSKIENLDQFSSK